MKIEKLTEGYYPGVAGIYLEGIATGHATFQTETPSWADWDKSHLEHCRFVAIENAKVIGWAALTPISGRCVYAGVAEVSIYIASEYRGKGIGDFLMKELIKASEANNIWTLQAGIFPENEASIKLHHNNEFRTVGIREKIGKMNNVWRNTVLLERRSKITGVS
ncbi:MAG TPA: GNAT family N-acetyltransferase [Bacteroidia bacterium]